jgi:hypothetical protein
MQSPPVSLDCTDDTPSPAPDIASREALRAVGLRPGLLSDEEREDHIASCTYLMEQAYARYRESGNFADRGEATRWMLMRNEAVKGRSARQVARMEAERGLCGR